MAIYSDVSRALDVFSTEPGAILYRDDDGWRALSPGNPGDILVIGDDNKPHWEAP